MERWTREARVETHQLAPAVLLHGFGDSPECWSPLLAAIDEDVDVATPAAPGHAGERLGPDGSINLDFLTEAALTHVAAAAERTDRAVVVGGHSMGAATALRVAVEVPELVAALYLEDPPWSWPPSKEPDPGVAAHTAELATWIFGLQSSSHDDRVRWCWEHNPGWPGDEYDIWATAKAELDPAVFDRPIDLGRFAWQGPAERVECPVVVLVGDWDRGSACMPAVADHLAQLPNWRVNHIHGTGHDVRRQNRGAAIAAFVDLLRQAA